MPILPIIFKIQEDSDFIQDLEGKINSSWGNNYLLKYPTVYIHYWKVKKESYTDEKGKTHTTVLYDAYVGESNNIIARTKQHYSEGEIETNWQYQMTHSRSVPTFIVIGNRHFNKSLTLDIENKLIEYIMSARCLNKIHNGRGNPQKNYYPEEEFEQIFSTIWRKLNTIEKDLFPPESQIFDSAIFKASPLKKLTDEQTDAKEAIIRKVLNAVYSKKEGQLVFVQGEAGTGKTVLTTSTFYELVRGGEELSEDQPLKCCLLVNHDQQLKVYEQMVKKLDLLDAEVSKPTSFINNHSEFDKVDVCFIDEGHLLLTQGKMGYRGKNQLDDIMKRSRVTVIMFDEFQVLTAEEYWEEEVLQKFKSLSKKQGNYITLSHQLRMNCAQTTMQWLNRFIFDRAVDKFIPDENGYEVKTFDFPQDLYSAIEKRSKETGNELSRIVASYDWDYSSVNRPEDGGLWGVKIGEWFLPWNYELERHILSSKEKRGIKSLAWAEQPQTIGEAGSTFTIQGFDLSYVGVILGPSVKYRNGKIVFDPGESKNDKATNKRTLSNGKKKSFGETFIRNEVKVLLTRGVKGLYVYAVDDELRKALKDDACL